MPLQKQIVTWPIAAKGLDSKTAPLSVQPGSQLSLQNIRQEREGEWKPRLGYTKTTLDTVVSQPVKHIGLPGGGQVAMTHVVDASTAVQAYYPNYTANRWPVAGSAGCSQSTPSVWSRRSVGATPNPGAYVQSAYAQDSLLSITAWATNAGAGTGITVRFNNLADGSAGPVADQIFPSANIPRCVATAGRLWLFYVDTSTNSVRWTGWDSRSGASVGGSNSANSNAIYFMDACAYGQALSCVFRLNTNNTRILEISATTGLSTNSIIIAYDCNQALALLPDPDNINGNRFVALSNTTPDTRVLNYDSTLTLVTDLSAGAFSAAAITGAGLYSGGTQGWMLLCQGGTGTITAVKRRSGVTSAPVALIPSTATTYVLASSAWREAGTDLTRFLIAFRGPTTDPQDTYLEMAVPFETGSSVMQHLFPEPQARLLPLAACAEGIGYLPRVQRIGAEQFVTALVRRGRISKANGAAADQFDIDRWQVDYLTTTNVAMLNQGSGTTTTTAAYLPAGSLLQSINGELVSHGLASIPTKPGTTPAAAGGAMAAGIYNYQVVVEALDPNGTIWRSAPSLPTAVTTTSATSQVTVTMQISATELSARPVTVKLYRTKVNGSVYQLVYSKTGAASALQALTYVDQTSDANMASSDFYFAETPATITPAFSHVVAFQGRLWGIERDFPNLWYSKPYTQGISPEFPGGGSFTVPVGDDVGAVTGMAALDDALVIFKQRSIYVVQGSTPDNAGGGRLPTVTRIYSDVGALPGTPIVGTGSELFFVAERGIQRINRTLAIDFVGAPVDVYLNQPSVQASLTVISGVFVPASNEVRFLLSDNSQQLIYDRLRDLWVVDLLFMSGPAVLRMVGTAPVMFANDGSLYIEGGATDAGSGFIAGATTAWVRPAGVDTSMRLYRVLLVGTQEAPGSYPTSNVTISVEYEGASAPQELSNVSIVSGTAAEMLCEYRPKAQRCRGFRLGFFMTGNIKFRPQRWSVVFGSKGTQPKLPAANRAT